MASCTHRSHRFRLRNLSHPHCNGISISRVARENSHRRKVSIKQTLYFRFLAEIEGALYSSGKFPNFPESLYLFFSPCLTRVFSYLYSYRDSAGEIAFFSAWGFSPRASRGIMVFIEKNRSVRGDVKGGVPPLPTQKIPLTGIFCEGGSFPLLVIVSNNYHFAQWNKAEMNNPIMNPSPCINKRKYRKS